MPHDTNQSSLSMNTDIPNVNPDLSVQEGAIIAHESTQLSSVNTDTPNVTVDNPDIIHKVEEFHRTLVTLQNVFCNVC